MRYLLIVILVTCLQPSFSQDSLEVESDLYRFSDAVLYTYAQPPRWQKKDLVRVTILLAGTAALTLLDEPVRDFFQRTRSDFPKEIEVAGFHMGKPYSAFITTGGFYLAGIIFKNASAKETALQLGVTLATSGLLQTLSKDLIGRARPITGEGAYSFDHFTGDAAYHSFLSGHIAVSFGTSLVLASRVKSVPVKMLFYSLAVSSALSRMYTDAHWLSDIAFGAALAWFCNETAAKRLTETSKGKRRGKIGGRWTFTPKPNGISLTGRL